MLTVAIGEDGKWTVSNDQLLISAHGETPDKALADYCRNLISFYKNAEDINMKQKAYEKIFDGLYNYYAEIFNEEVNRNE